MFEFYLAVYALLGLIFGSFASMLTYRLPLYREDSECYHSDIGVAPSACPNCEQRIPWFANIPLLGWLILKGRCNACKQKISARYPIIESATMLLFVGNYLAFGISLMGVFALLLAYIFLIYLVMAVEERL